jgi:diguanylate cyclase (GGDEF)-like protein
MESALSVPESIVRLSFLLAALILLPLCRRWIGGPLWTLVAAAAGLLVVTVADIRRLALALGRPDVPDTLTWANVYVQAIGYFGVLLGFLIWVWHIRRSRVELSQMAATDPLTRLTNRRQTMLLFQHERVRARRKRAPMSIIMIDLDHFKPVNDRFGHLAGDVILKHVAQVLKNRVRAADIVARYGGDEFLLILPEAGTRAALQVAIELRRAFNESPAAYCGMDVPIQASFGVAGLECDQDLSPEDLIERADKAVYFVKRSGGNGVADWASMESNQACAAPNPVEVEPAPAL